MEVQRGTRGSVGSCLDESREIEIQMEVSGGAVYDYCCFGVDAAGSLSDDRYMVFYNQSQSPEGEISYAPAGQGARFTVNLNRLPASIQKLVFTVSIDGQGRMGEIDSHILRVCQDGRAALETRLTGGDFLFEKAIISMELYRKGVWRFAIVARGFNGGLGDLLRFYGGTEETESPAASAPPPVTPQITPPVSPIPPQNQEAQARNQKAQDGETVTLRNPGNGEIRVSLKWRRTDGQGLPVDLDLGCLYELKNGRKGCIQALGNAFGNLLAPPYIALQGDDRTGGAGEILRINGGMIARIRRILLYAFIYDGAANWTAAGGTATIRAPENPDIVIRLDDNRSNLGTCAIALLENVRDETFRVKKAVKFFNDHRDMDAAFHWGMQWKPGKK